MRRVDLARQALTISPDCADAYLLLAEEAASSLEEARELLERGVAAGERALGPEPFEEDVGYFWGILETRPYMRPGRARRDALGARSASGKRSDISMSARTTTVVPGAEQRAGRRRMS